MTHRQFTVFRSFLRMLCASVRICVGLSSGLPFFGIRAAEPFAWPAAKERSAKKNFAIPAGEAFTTLKRFFAQSGEPLIYKADVVEGVQTNAIKGKFTSREALEHMLSGTTLYVKQDQATGVLAIIAQETSAERSNASPSASPDENLSAKKKRAQTVKTKNPLTLFAGWMTLMLAPAHATSANAAQAGVPNSTQATGSIFGRVQNVVTGQYLNNARVSVRGTTLIAYTDQYGTYRLSPVPKGAVTLDVFYTGLDPVGSAVQVREGEVLEHNVNLTSEARYGTGWNTVQLDSFVVTESKDMDAESIAINEQRFAANIKNVLAPDAFGDVMGSQLGDFLKFIPGVTGQYANGEIVQISVRGIGGDMTSITSDGAPVASTSNAGERDAHTVNLSLRGCLKRWIDAKIWLYL